MMTCWMDYSVAETLIKHGANTKCHDVFGRSTVYMARNIETVHLLMQNGASLKTKDIFDRSVLCQNLLVSDEDCVEYLINKTDDVNLQDKFKSTPLHYAAYADEGNLVRLLLQNKADRELKDMEGNTARDVAKMHSCKRALEVFEENEQAMCSELNTELSDCNFSNTKEIVYPDDLDEEVLKLKLNPRKDIHVVAMDLVNKTSTTFSKHKHENKVVCSGVLDLVKNIAKRFGENRWIIRGSASTGRKCIWGNKNRRSRWIRLRLLSKGIFR